MIPEEESCDEEGQLKDFLSGKAQESTDKHDNRDRDEVPLFKDGHNVCDSNTAGVLSPGLNDIKPIGVGNLPLVVAIISLPVANKVKLHIVLINFLVQFLVRAGEFEGRNGTRFLLEVGEGLPVGCGHLFSKRSDRLAAQNLIISVPMGVVHAAIWGLTVWGEVGGNILYFRTDPEGQVLGVTSVDGSCEKFAALIHIVQRKYLIMDGGRTRDLVCKHSTRCTGQ